MENLSRVLKRRRAELGLTLADIAEKMGVSEATVQRWEVGVIKSIRYEKMTRLAEILGVNPSEFMGWNEPAVATDVVTFDVYANVAAHFAAAGIVDVTPDKVEIPRSHLHGRPASDFFVLRVTGDSMYPLYMDGDIVLVLKTPTLQRSGQVGVLQNGDDATLKKVEYKAGEDWMRLIPINPNYPPQLVEGADLEEWRVRGIPRLVIREIDD